MLDSSSSIHRFITDPATRLVVDSWAPYDAWAEEYGTQADDSIGIVGNHWHTLIDQGQMSTTRIQEIADIATGIVPGRQSDDEIILYSAGGMPIEDVAWATEVYHNAIDKQLGISLNLWESPTLV